MPPADRGACCAPADGRQQNDARRHECPPRPALVPRVHRRASHRATSWIASNRGARKPNRGHWPPRAPAFPTPQRPIPRRR